LAVAEILAIGTWAGKEPVKNKKKANAFITFE
jgi:hypothetical protein